MARPTALFFFFVRHSLRNPAHRRPSVGRRRAHLQLARRPGRHPLQVRGRFKIEKNFPGQVSFFWYHRYFSRAGHLRFAVLQCSSIQFNSLFQFTQSNTIFTVFQITAATNVADTVTPSLWAPMACQAPVLWSRTMNCTSCPVSFIADQLAVCRAISLKAELSLCLKWQLKSWNGTKGPSTHWCVKEQMQPLQKTLIKSLRGGYFRYFLIFSITKNDFLHFYQVNLPGSGLFK